MLISQIHLIGLFLPHVTIVNFGHIQSHFIVLKKDHCPERARENRANIFIGSFKIILKYISLIILPTLAH